MMHRDRSLRRVRAFLAGAALLATLAGCAVSRPDPPALPFTLPVGFMAGAPVPQRIAQDDYWWRDFADPVLDQFVEDALLKNPALAQAVARTRIAEAQTRLQRGERLPQVGLGAGVTRQRQNLGSLPGLGAAAGDLGEAGGLGGAADDVRLYNTNSNAALDVSWELDLWGRLSALSSSAQASYLASEAQLRGLRQSISAQVVQLYFDIVHARAQVDLSDRTVESLQEMARQINNRVAVGIASPTDGLLADANLESARAGLEQRREALARALRQLEVLLGDYPAGQLRTAEVLPEVPQQPAVGIPAELLVRRPDVQAAELSLLAAGYELGAAQRSFLPSLSLGASLGFAGTTLSDLFRSGNVIWSIAGNLLQPIFQGGRLVAQVDIAGGQRDETLAAYAETALTALSEVETALAVETVLLQREQALEASAESAEQAVRVSLNRYLQGIDPFLNVLESQQRALDGRSAHITAHLARLENRIALHLALGGGFENEGRTPP